MQQHLMKQDRSSRLPSREELCNSQFQQLLLATEGQCRIQTIRYLRANYLKGVILTTLLAVTLVGLLCLKYFKKLRAFVFYDTVSQQQLERITHVYVSGTDKAEQISKVEAIQYENERRWLFQFKKLRYQLFQDRWLPLGLPYMRDIDRLKSDTFLSEGLASESSAQKVRVYGRNEHNVQVPSYPQYVFDTMTQPFFLFQYFVSLIYALQNVMLFSVLMIAFGFITTTVNYILLRRSYNKIKETAEKRFMVQVLRNGTFRQLQNTEILPGDLFVPCQEIPCDGIVVRGELFVDEVSLTGETVPIAKFAVADGRKVNNKQHWLWEGSKLETMKGNSLALAVSVGYASRRGRIIRKILTRVGQQPQFFRKIIYFQIEVLFVSILLYLFTLPNLLSLNVDGYLVIFRFCDFITYSFPAPYPIFFNLAYSFCLVRLNQAGILGTQPEKTVQGSRLKTMCFDKTGTLTLNRMQVCKLYSAQGPNNFNQITGSSPDKALIANCLATCNSVELINGEVKGDEIDLRLFEFFKGRLQTSDKSGVVRQVITYGRALEVIKINQYESQFQSMSVLVREPQAGRCYVFVKGSPEMIHNYSTTKFAGFQEFIKKMSFSGYRSIGFGFKEVQPQEIESMLHGTREEFLKHTKLLGIVTFVNQLKDDAISTIETLAEAGITTKIITGDNIFLGVQTAFATGMIESQARVLVVEGSKYNLASKELQAFELTRSQDGTFNEKLRLFKDFSYQSDDEVVYAIDNDFIVLKGEDFLHDSVKVFARISPENKALIVKKHKQKEQQAVNSRQGIKKLLGDCSFKVGMVGDGANDLIAIKQADLGIGISSSDAIYSASFAVTQLGQIAEVLIESKNSERQINEMAKYYGITQFLSIVFTLIMTNDYAYMTSLELIYKNFFNTLLITLLYGRSKPAAKLSKQMPSSNFLDLENHLIFWGNTLICSLGLIISYAYYSHTDDFQRNSHQEARFPDGWFSETKTSTINFIAANIVFIVLPVFIYQSAPWKRPLWTNRGLLMLLIANVVVLGVICYTTESLGSLTIQPIGKKEVTVVIVIMVATCLLCGVMNYLLQWFYLRRQRFRRQGAQEHALVEY